MKKLADSSHLHVIHTEIENMYANFLKDASHYFSQPGSAVSYYNKLYDEIAKDPDFVQFSQYIIGTNNHKHIGFIIMACFQHRLQVIACYTRPKFRRQGYMAAAFSELPYTIYECFSYTAPFENSLGRITMRKIVKHISNAHPDIAPNIFNPAQDFITIPYQI